MFERLEGAEKSIEAPEIIEQLNGGLSGLDPSVVKALERIMPNGRYEILLQRVQPTLVKPGEKGDYFSGEQSVLEVAVLPDGLYDGPHSPETEYYRLPTRMMKESNGISDRGLFEFLIPTFPHDRLNVERLAEYQRVLSKGAEPTAIAISVLDGWEPFMSVGVEDNLEITSHLCVAHYLIDGHHKAYAAAVSGKPITLISFLAVEHSVSSEEDISELLKKLSEE
jgi:hypothetical protein